MPEQLTLLQHRVVGSVDVVSTVIRVTSVPSVEHLSLRIMEAGRAVVVQAEILVSSARNAVSRNSSLFERVSFGTLVFYA